MRHPLLVTALLAPLLLLGACGSDGGSSADTSLAGATTAPGQPEATTTTLAKPSVSVPGTDVDTLRITDLVTGTGPAAATGDVVVLHYVGVRSTDGVEFDNSYDRGQPFEVMLGAGKVIEGWEKGLLGVQAGGRRQLDIPASMAYGDAGQGDVIRPGDSLTFVVDVLAVVPGSTQADQPDITVAPAANIPVISSTDLVVGTGPSPVNGNRVAVQIMLFRADTGVLLNSTWGTPPVVFDYTTTSNTFPGIIATVKGMKVGGRREAQVPFSLMFDGQGNQQLQLPAGVDVVLVMDLVAVY